MSLDVLPLGKKPIYIAIREAGVAQARPLRNIPWMNIADDGVTVMNIWRRQLRERDGTLVAIIDARHWLAHGGTQRKKREAVVNGLAALDGRQIRVVLLEERVPNSRHSAGAQYDHQSLWLVEDTGDDFLLWRGRTPDELNQPVPATPAAFGNISPQRKEVVSTRIERDPRVRSITLERARNRCENSDCRIWVEFESLDVHHITHLGNGGADHTDNTVALCPTCHAKVHRGIESVRADMARILENIRKQRLMAE